MGYVFEELIRRFNEENNEEAGEHFTPREVIQLMTRLLFEPVKDSLPQVIAIYDGACGSGGMLTESENLLLDKDKGFGLIPERIHLFGKEINPETYAICQSDMMIKGKDPQHIQFGSTLSVDSFQARQFDFMLSNPPYGKSWQSEKKHLFDGSELLDDRFKVKLTDYHGHTQEVDATPRSSDGQLLFLMDMVSKMKPLFVSPQGSRIASVHNGSSLFTGNAGGGESNTRRTIIENDLLEAIIQLPNNLFYNTGITTYIWLLSNNKAPHRKGKVQLLDASQMFQKLRKNLGAKNCALTPEHIQQLLEVYREMPDNEISKVFDNRDFGHVRIQVERPLRLSAQLTDEAIASLRFRNDLREPMMWVWKHYGEAVYTGLKEHQGQILDHADKEGWKLNDKKKDNLLSVKAWSEQRSVMEQAQALREELGGEVIEDYNLFVKEAEAYFKKEKLKLSAGIKKQLYAAASYTNEDAPPVLKKVHKLKGEKLQEILRSLLPAFRTSDAEASSVPADHAEQQFSLFPSSEPAPVSEMEDTALLAFAEKHLADFGYWPGEKAGEFVEYVTDSDLKDVETIPLKQPVHHYFQTEVRPYVKDAWLNLDKAQIGYEISFNKVFYRHEPLRSLEEVSADILQLEQETEGLLKQLLQWGQA
jgi:type I restriction enzyme M protein